MAKRRKLKALKTARQVEYHPPSDEHIAEFARKVCQGLGETVDKRYEMAGAHFGLASFLRVVASIRVQQLNQKKEEVLDSDPKLK